VISHGLWQRRFGGSPSALGATLLLDREPRTIVGIMPPGFGFPLRGPRINGEPAELWVPVAVTDAQRARRGGEYNFTALGRLRPGVTLAAGARRRRRSLPASSRPTLRRSCSS
jgi:putative ABC transport system permease protein